MSINLRSQKISGKNSIIQNSMFHLDLGIQIKQGWQFLYCQNAIEKNFFFISTCPFSHMFCIDIHIVKYFPRDFWGSPLFIFLSSLALSLKPLSNLEMKLKFQSKSQWKKERRKRIFGSSL